MKNTKCCFHVVKDDVFLPKEMNSGCDTSLAKLQRAKKECSFKINRATFIQNKERQNARKVLLYIEGFLSCALFLAIGIEN